VLEVEMDNIINFDFYLAKLLKERPLEFHPIFEKCAKICYMKEFQKEEKDSPDF
jgi:DNA replicative helicase MCM subunit Mcm2 (Cdc46/Mcm family)